MNSGPDASASGRRPDFLVCGAEKAGTSWLHACLEDHPEVFVPQRKELHYFTKHFEHGDGWYLAFFEPAGAGQAAGECSPSYLYRPEAAARIREFLPSAKLVFVLREPVSRAYSNYCMDLSSGDAPRDIGEALAPGSRIAEVGLYGEQIGRFADLFPREQMHVALYDDLRGSPDTFLRHVFAFLGVSPGFEPASKDARIHGRKPPKRFPGLHGWIVRASSAVARRSRAVSNLIHRGRRRNLFRPYHVLAGKGEYPELTPAVRARLDDYYRPDIERLSNWLGRDLSHWTPTPAGHDA